MNLKVTQTKWLVKPTPSMKRSYDEIVSLIDSTSCDKIKISREKNRKGERLVCPTGVNKSFARLANKKRWKSYKFNHHSRQASWEVDFYRDRIAIEIQLGKYPFVSHDLSKMKILHRFSRLEGGILIVPSRVLQKHMSSGVGCFEQAVCQVHAEGLQLPIVILGVEPVKVQDLFPEKF